MEPVGVGKIPEDNVQHIRHFYFRQSAVLLLNYFKWEITDYNLTAEKVFATLREERLGIQSYLFIGCFSPGEKLVGFERQWMHCG